MMMMMMEQNNLRKRRRNFSSCAQSILSVEYRLLYVSIDMDGI